MRTKPLILFLLLCYSQFACTESKRKKLTTQYLLTNKISIQNRDVALGASSYLFNYKGVTYLCTAKHLTGQAMGFEPEIDLKTINDSLLYWKAYPRTNKLSSDTLYANKLLYFDDVYDDIVLLRLKSPPNNIGVLTPSFKVLHKGDRLRVLGCPYNDYDCFQNEYFGSFNEYTEGDKLEISMDSSNFDITGFSGAPILNESNQVVGHILAGGDVHGVLTIYASPIELVKKIITRY